MALEAPRPCSSKRRFDPPLASKPGLCKTTRASTHRTASPSSPSRPVENARPGWMTFRSAAFDEGIHFVTRCAELSGEQPTFSKNEYPSSTSPTGLRGFRPQGPRGSRFMALHSLRITRVRGGDGMLLRLRTRIGFPLTLHLDRFPLDRMNGAGVRRPGAPSTGGSAPFARVEFPRSG
jgi:hypothetical protein